MESVLTFLSGFIIASGVGWISSLLLAFWNTIEKKRKQRPSRSTNLDSELALRQILMEGCWRIAWLVLLQITLLVSLCGIIFIFRRELLPHFYIGVICAFVLGFHLQNIRYIWKKIIQLYKIFNSKIREKIKSIKLWFNELQTKLQKLESSKNDTLEAIYESFPERPQRVSELKKLVVTKSRLLQKLKEKQALYGISIDSYVLIQIEDTEIELEELKAALLALETEV